MITRSPKQQSIMLAGLLIALLVTTPRSRNSQATNRRLNRRSRGGIRGLEANAHTATSATTVPGRPDIPMPRSPSSCATSPLCRSARRKTSCRSRNSSYPRVLRSKSMRAASLMRVRCVSATRALCSSAIVFSTRFTAIVEKNGKREIRVIASGLDRPNGLAFHKGVLYNRRRHQNFLSSKTSKTIWKIRPSPS